MSNRLASRILTALGHCPCYDSEIRDSICQIPPRKRAGGGPMSFVVDTRSRGSSTEDEMKLFRYVTGSGEALCPQDGSSGKIPDEARHHPFC